MTEWVGDAIEPIMAAAPRLAAGVVMILAFWGAGILVRHLFTRIGRSMERGVQPVLTLIGRTGEVLLILVGAVAGLATLGVQTAELIAGLGLTGFALGFALRDALSNILSGALILVYRPFKLHDHIMVAGFEGRVVQIDFRYTTLRYNEEKKVLIPNSLLFTNSITVVEKQAEPSHEKTSGA